MGDNRRLQRNVLLHSGLWGGLLYPLRQVLHHLVPWCPFRKSWSTSSSRCSWHGFQDTVGKGLWEHQCCFPWGCLHFIIPRKTAVIGGHVDAPGRKEFFWLRAHNERKDRAWSSSWIPCADRTAEQAHDCTDMFWRHPQAPQGSLLASIIAPKSGLHGSSGAQSAY